MISRTGALGFTDPRAASDAAFAEEQARRLADATDKSAAALYNFAEAAQRAADVAASDLSTSRSLTGRILTASGDTRGADDINRLNSNTQELAQAVKDGMTPANLALLQLAQFAEASAVQMQRAIEDGTKQLTAAAAAQTALYDKGITQTQYDAALSAKQSEYAISEAQKSATAQAKSDQDRIDVDQQNTKSLLALQDVLAEQARTTQQLMQAQLQVAQQALSVDQKALDSLSGIKSATDLGDLSTLSPAQKLEESRQQLLAIANAARGGDASAASNFGGAYNTFLTQDRSFNGTSAAYGTDKSFADQLLNELTTQFGAAVSRDQGAVNTAQAGVNGAQFQLDAIAQAKDAISAAGDASVKALQALKDQNALDAANNIQALNDAKDTAAQGYSAELARLNALKDAVSVNLQTSIDALVAQETAANQYRIDHATIAQPVTIAPVTVATVGETQIVNTLQAQNASLQQQLAASQAQAAAQIATLQAGFNALSDKLDALAGSVDEGSRTTKQAVQELAGAL